MASEGGTDKVSRQNSATILICFVCERNRKWWGAISFSLHFKGKDSYRRAYLSLTNSAQYPISPPWRALCHLWRCLQEAEVLDRGFCDLWALKNQHWPHSGFAIHADMSQGLWVKWEIPGCRVGWVFPTAPGTHLTPNLGTSSDWKEAEEGAGCQVGLRNNQTLMWVLLSTLSSSVICNSRHHFSLWRQSFRNPAGWNVHIIPASSLLLCWFTVLGYW